MGALLNVGNFAALEAAVLFVGYSGKVMASFYFSFWAFRLPKEPEGHTANAPGAASIGARNEARRPSSQQHRQTHDAPQWAADAMTDIALQSIDHSGRDQAANSS